MANEILLKPKTVLSWTTLTSPALTLTSLAVGAGRCGGQQDLGSTRPRKMRWRLKTMFASAPTEGRMLEIYLATSEGTNVDAGLGTSDAALSAAAQRFQCQFIGFAYCRAITGSQVMSGECEVTARYVSPVIYNGADQALHGTAGNHEFILEPFADEIQDGA